VEVMSPPPAAMRRIISRKTKAFVCTSIISVSS
jgi:hypothetical protein